jgi:hypothetical protein
LAAVAAIVIGTEVDRILVDAVQQAGGDFGHARFGVALGRGIIAVDIAEIALPVDQRVADGEILGETRQRIIDRLIAGGASRSCCMA